MMQLVVDTEMCSGHGRCYTLAAKLVGADDEGFPTLIGDESLTDPGDEELARRAIASCPEGALGLVDAR